MSEKSETSASQGTSRIRVGSAPDSWGVWFPDDPEQVPWQRFLDEVSACGYEWIELGPYGYLPTDPARLSDELGSRGLKVSAGTVFEHLHRPDSWDAVWDQVKDVAALTKATGGTHVVVIPGMFRDEKTGVDIEPRRLTPEAWEAKTTGVERLGRAVQEEYGLSIAYHPHAESHVGYQADIERFLADTDPAYVPLCLDTGHISYYRGDNLHLIRTYPERIGYLHLKQVDPAVIDRVLAEDVVWPEAVRMGAMIEPPNGEPAYPPLFEAIEELGLDVFAIVEHDMYPCPPDQPLPIAERTHRYIAGCGIRSLEIGLPRTSSEQPT
ncbi:MAG: TIM barrel protein [Blastococcus sp.]